MAPPIGASTTSRSFSFPDLSSFAAGLFEARDYNEFDLGQDTQSLSARSPRSQGSLSSRAESLSTHTFEDVRQPKRQHTSDGGLVPLHTVPVRTSSAMSLGDCDRFFELTDDGLTIVPVESLAVSRNPSCLLRRRPGRNSDKYFTCNYESCRKEFPSKDKIVRHLRQEHTDIKPYKCIVEGCGHVSNDESNLSSHVKVRHLLCNKCGTQFANRDEATQHRHKMVRTPAASSST